MSETVIRKRVLEILAALPPTHSMYRRDISFEIHGTDKIGAGSTYAACAWLQDQGWVERRPGNYRYRITELGRLNLEAADVFEAVS